MTSLTHGLSASQLKFCFSDNVCYNLLLRSKKRNSESMTLSSLLTYSKWNTNALKSTQNTELYLLYHLAFLVTNINPMLLTMNCMPAAVWTPRLPRFLAEMAYQSRKHQKKAFFLFGCFLTRDSGFFWFSNKLVCFSHKISQHKMVIHTSRQAKIWGHFY